jgi:hypothetical protein
MNVYVIHDKSKNLYLDSTQPSWVDSIDKGTFFSDYHYAILNAKKFADKNIVPQAVSFIIVKDDKFLNEDGSWYKEQEQAIQYPTFSWATTYSRHHHGSKVIAQHRSETSQTEAPQGFVSALHENDKVFLQRSQIVHLADYAPNSQYFLVKTANDFYRVKKKDMYK